MSNLGEKFKIVVAECMADMHKVEQELMSEDTHQKLSDIEEKLHWTAAHEVTKTLRDQIRTVNGVKKRLSRLRDSLIEHKNGLSANPNQRRGPKSKKL